jgi:hypothetical protein
MSGTCTQYIRVALLLLLLSVAFIECSNNSGTQCQFTVDGRVYRYRVLEQNIKDLDTDLLNVKKVATAHCDLTISNNLDSSLSKVIQWAEDGYERVSKDFGFEMASQRPIIFYVNHIQYSSLTPIISGGCLSNDAPDGHKRIFMDAEHFPPEAPVTPEVFVHELCHYVCYYLRGGTWPGDVTGEHLRSFVRFEEAIAQEEELSRDPIPVDLRKTFPDGNYITLDQMDSDTSGIAECRALVQLLTTSGQPGALTRICVSLGTMTVPEAIEKETGWTSAELLQKWFSYMDSLRLGKK